MPVSRFDGVADLCKTCLHRSGRQRCGKCRLVKALDAYFADKRRPSGRYTTCKTCAKVPTAVAAAWRRKRKYGLTADAHAAILSAQNALCGVCGNPEYRVRLGKALPLHVDHDHKTGEVRGLLCTDCNLGVGRFKDSPKLLRAAAAYLEKYGERNIADRAAAGRNKKSR